MKIFPVIQFLDNRTTQHQSSLAQQSGADGVLISSHRHQFKDALRACCETKQIFAGLRVFFKSDEVDPLELLTASVAASLDGILIHSDTFSPFCINSECLPVADFAKANPQFTVFATVASSYVLRHEGHIEREASKFSLRTSVLNDSKPDEALTLAAACIARESGFIPLVDWANTAGVEQWDSASARANRFVKIFEALKGCVAIATGFGATNLFSYPPYYSHIVETNSMSMSEYGHDLKRVRSLLVRSGQAALPVMV